MSIICPGWELPANVPFRFARTLLDMLQSTLTAMIEKFQEENPALTTQEVISRLNQMYMTEVRWVESCGFEKTKVAGVKNAAATIITLDHHHIVQVSLTCSFQMSSLTTMYVLKRWDLARAKSCHVERRGGSWEPTSSGVVGVAPLRFNMWNLEQVPPSLVSQVLLRRLLLQCTHWRWFMTSEALW